MRWISILKAVLGFLYFFAWFQVLAFPMYFVMADDGYTMSFELGGYLLSNGHWTFYLVLSCCVAAQFFFLGMIYYLRAAARLMTPQQGISFDVSKHLNRAGLACVIGALLFKIPAFFYFFSNNNTVNRPSQSMNMGYSFDSLLMLVAFGIILILISKIIGMSVLVKQENDLTI
ncbi:DUF2975 domain-containing protein [Nonlabens antarcticus]|uniref:DUF2975 domain-containing protein n=1 Tax=Nonlabens antarcticus TaxID=392714 RepID=UPI001891DC56|nr:DUF2975 domain-containing protein [Nonlabens antarcticus]